MITPDYTPQVKPARYESPEAMVTLRLGILTLISARFWERERGSEGVEVVEKVTPPTPER